MLEQAKDTRASFAAINTLLSCDTLYLIIIRATE